MLQFLKKKQFVFIFLLTLMQINTPNVNNFLLDLIEYLYVDLNSLFAYNLFFKHYICLFKLFYQKLTFDKTIKFIINLCYRVKP